MEVAKRIKDDDKDGYFDPFKAFQEADYLNGSLYNWEDYYDWEFVDVELLTLD